MVIAFECHSTYQVSRRLLCRPQYSFHRHGEKFKQEVSGPTQPITIIDTRPQEWIALTNDGAHTQVHMKPTIDDTQVHSGPKRGKARL